MPEVQRREAPSQQLCGLASWHPAWMQKYATTKMFMLVYGLLGTIQATSFMYFVVTLTTVEKRFKIPSQTTGIILSGNEISQIMLSLILSYIGGQRNRPRWIAYGIAICGLSCFILALPHFIYGAGVDALQLTKEYSMDGYANSSITLAKFVADKSDNICRNTKFVQECEDILSVVPLIVIFLSQFVLGVGNTLYYSLGQTYLDDNTKKTNTPLMLSVAMTLRMFGPIAGFLLGFVSLNMFIDPSKTPIIDKKDPRWLGAWWFGWMILGSFMVLFSGLIGLFPKKLPKPIKAEAHNSHMPHVLRLEELRNEENGLPLGRNFSSNLALDKNATTTTDFPKLKDFPTALMRLLRNKLLIFNILSAVFYILGASGYITFLTKYMEVQFHKAAQSATIVVGPVSIIGVCIGLLGSGLIISKKKPSVSKVLLWNLVVGSIFICGQITYMFMYCEDTISAHYSGDLNFTTACNSNCSCDGIPYAPVCHEASETTYFSPCHAGCRQFNATERIYSNCACLNGNSTIEFDQSATTSAMGSRIFATESTAMELPQTIQTILSSTFSSSLPVSTAAATTLNSIVYTTTKPTTSYEAELDATTDLLSRARRSLSNAVDTLKPGVCDKGCDYYFYAFGAASLVVQFFGSSGRIGSLLVNYRAVATEDKSFAQGLSLMMLSLLALIPGPIILGRVIDSTCLVWTKTCSGNGNCQLYDQARFRYMVNGIAIFFTSIGIFFDFLVWYYGRSLDLYGDKEAQRAEELKKKNQAITPLLASK